MDIENTFQQFMDNNYDDQLRYFIFSVSYIDKSFDADDLAQKTFIKLHNAIMKMSLHNTDIWVGLLYKIRKWVKDDYVKRSCYLNDKIIDLEDKDIENIKDESIQPYTDQNIRSGINIIKRVLNTKRRSLQDVILIGLAPNAKVVRNKISEKYPRLFIRAQKRGINYEVQTKQRNGLGETLADDLMDDISSFSKLISLEVETLKVDDEVGKRALKILFLYDDPWRHWIFIGGGTSKDYLTFNKRGVLIRKRYISRPRPSFTRDILSLFGVPLLKQFLRYEVEGKYVDEPIDQDFVRRYFNITSVKPDTLKKQRKGTKDRPGLIQQIKIYDQHLKELIKTL